MTGSHTASKRTRASVSRFLSNIMEPLARIAMRYGYSAREATDVVRWSFVRSFFNTPEFWGGPTPTFVQGAIKTGLPRQQVKQLNALPVPDCAIFAYRQNLAYRVVEGWVNDPEFHRDGEPAELPVTHPREPSFNKLVMKYGNDVTYGPVLKDLESAGCVETRGSTVVLRNTTYGIHLVDEERMELGGYMLGRAVESTDHNLRYEPADQRLLQRVWRQVLIPVDSLREVQESVAAIAIRAGREADAELSRYAHTQRQSGIKYAEVGLVSFVFVEPEGEAAKGSSGKSKKRSSTR